jgi:hypothetical protein
MRTVRSAVCGSATGSVWHCVAVPAHGAVGVWQCAQQYAAVRLVVCGIVWQCQRKAQ